MLIASTATWLRALNWPCVAAREEDGQADRAAEDVRAVEAGERVEDGAEDAVADAEAQRE